MYCNIFIYIFYLVFIMLSIITHRLCYLLIIDISIYVYITVREIVHVFIVQ